MLQGLMLLTWGFAGVAPVVLIDWKLREITLMLILAVFWFHLRLKKHNLKIKGREP